MRCFMYEADERKSHLLPEGCFQLGALYEVKGDDKVFADLPFKALCENTYEHRNLSSLRKDIADQLGCKESNIRIVHPDPPSNFDLK